MTLETHGLKQFLATQDPIVRVELTAVNGSSPRDVGTVMFVSMAAIWGTIGGGQLEYMMIDHARKLITAGTVSDAVTISLGPEIGQCCGGRVAVSLAQMHPQDKQTALKQADAMCANLPTVYLLGAGHIGRAIANLMQHLPVKCILVDTRAEEIALCDAKVEKRICALPEREIHAARANSGFVIATHDHALDFLLTSAALGRGDGAYVGMIGSATKRTKFERWCQQYCDDQNIAFLTCPIGANTLGDKRPSVIATFVVAEVMQALGDISRQSVVSVKTRSRVLD